MNGLASASELFLVASGLSIIFGVMRIVNFAHGSFYMLGAYIAYTCRADGGFARRLLAGTATGGAGGGGDRRAGGDRHPAPHLPFALRSCSSRWRRSASC
ncbi:MAG: hypothetical protein U1E35_06935 [Rhodospirillales bacterium]